MLNLDLSSSEVKTLHDALESYISDLRMEIADTDKKDFRDNLKDKKETLKKVVEALKKA